ncbi:MAG: outer membrane protein assembly factor, partial [Candidatus Korobacteraceae bacterium]
DRGFLQASVEYSVNMDRDDEKRVIFDIQRGTRFSDVRTVFAGAEAISPDQLSELLEGSDLKDVMLTRPREVRELIANYYRNQGYLAATVEAPFPEVDPQNRQGSIVIPIKEGPLFRLAAIRFEGAKAFPEQRLRTVVSMRPGERYNPTQRDPSIVDLQSLYGNNGYLDANVQFTPQVNERAATVTAVFLIEEGEQSVVHEVVITGNEYVTRGLISSQILAKPGEVLTAPALSNSRANLYETGAFQLIEIERRPLERTPDMKPNQRSVDLLVNVVEVPPFQWRYGGYFDTDRGPGGISDFSSRNITGNAQTMGLRTRYDRNLQEGRIYFSQPLLRRFPVKTTASTYFTRNSRFGGDDQISLIDDHMGISLEQESRFRKDYLLTWAYRLERVRIFNRGLEDGAEVPVGSDLDFEDPGSIPPIGESISRRVAPLIFTMTRETRDDVINATRGLFLSHSLSTGFGFLGSQQQFVKYYGQYYQYIPLGRPQQAPFQRGERPRLLYAGALRLGFAGGLGGQALIQSERFYAGGGTTVRGFSQDQVGPKQGDIPLGGNAVFILNNELRFPLKWIFDGVVFVDVGNVYSHVSDFNPFSVRKAAGIGLRIHNPWILFRVDLGFKLDRRPGERLWQPFGSIGQAF